jgi:hypothetical protein
MKPFDDAKRCDRLSACSLRLQFPAALQIVPLWLLQKSYLCPRQEFKPGGQTLRSPSARVRPIDRAWIFYLRSEHFAASEEGVRHTNILHQILLAGQWVVLQHNDVT